MRKSGRGFWFSSSKTTSNSPMRIVVVIEAIDEILVLVTVAVIVVVVDSIAEIIIDVVQSTMIVM